MVRVRTGNPHLSGDATFTSVVMLTEASNIIQTYGRLSGKFKGLPLFMAIMTDLSHVLRQLLLKPKYAGYDLRP